MIFPASVSCAAETGSSIQLSFEINGADPAITGATIGADYLAMNGRRITGGRVVIKSLETNCGRIEGLAGATILGDGSVAFILDMVGLVRLARQGTRAARDVGGSGDASDSDASGDGRTTRAARGASHAARS